MIGRTLAHYRITAAIGAGGMGEVYRATDTKLGRDVALKVLPAEMASRPERLERFRREAKALAALDHPGVVSVYSVEEADGVHFLTMQLVEGQPLDRTIPEGGLPVGRILEIGVALAEALAAAHDKGIVHRDLKPANVMVTSGGRVKVLDFGLARMTGLQPEPSAGSELPTDLRTREGVVMGTVPYMSPEQVSGREMDHRTDLFSLGVILYEMAAGRRPFQGSSSAELASSILRDTPRPLRELRGDLPAGLAQVIGRCLEKDAADRYPSARDARDGLRGVTAEASAMLTAATPSPRPVAAADSAAARAEGGFWVAVLPFKYGGGNAEVTALAEGLSEEIVTGLSRFSYLRVIARSSTSSYSGEGLDVRSIGHELGARYVMEGSVRQSGATLRVAAQLVDATTGAHLWAETYNRPFHADAIFELQDDLVPRIVSTVADWYGILPHSMSEALRSRSPEELSPYEAVLRSFGYGYRRTPEEHAVVRAGLERAVQQAPDYADAWAMLSFSCSEEYAFGFNVQPDALERTLQAARRAADVEPLNALANNALARALFFRKEFQAFRIAAERAMQLQPMNGATRVLLGSMMAYAGDWEHGCALVEQGAQLNPRHPGWHWFPLFHNAYRKGDYRAALNIALKINLPHFYRTHVLTAAAYGQLGERDAAGRALRELLTLRPDLAATAREEFGKWYDSELVEQLIDGLRKAGLEKPTETQSPGASATKTPEAAAAVAIAVLPFSDMSAAKDQEYLCEGMAEEIMNALVRIQGIRVASRTSAFQVSRSEKDLVAIGRALSVEQVLEGSVRTAGERLRVTAQLSDVASGYQLWSERYDREAADIFAVQDEIARGVVDAVKARLSSGEHALPARQQPENLEAYRSYLMGRYLRHTKNDHGGALRAFEEAVRLDPSHGPAWVGVAEATILAAHYSLIPARAAYARASEVLAIARRLQGESADALYIEGMRRYMEGSWTAVDAPYSRALELQPRHVHALGTYGVILCGWGRCDEGLALLARAREVDPLASFPCAMTGVGCVAARRPQESLRYFEDALSFEKENNLALWGSCMAHVALGRFEEGIANAGQAVAVTRRAAFFVGLLGWALAAAGRKDDARALLEELRARPADAPTVVSKAWLLAALGETDAAFEVVSRAEEERQAFVNYTGLPGFDPLRSDPRFAALMKKLGVDDRRPASR